MLHREGARETSEDLTTTVSRGPQNRELLQDLHRTRNRRDLAHDTQRNGGPTLLARQAREQGQRQEEQFKAARLHAEKGPSWRVPTRFHTEEGRRSQ